MSHLAGRCGSVPAAQGGTRPSPEGRPGGRGSARSWPRPSAAAAPPAGGSGPPSGPPAAPEGETLVLRELPQVLATRFPPWHGARNPVTHPHPSLAPHLVNGGFQEVVQQQPGFGQGAGADHHRGVRGVQLLLKRGETRAGCSRVALLLDVGQVKGLHGQHSTSTTPQALPSPTLAVPSLPSGCWGDPAMGLSNAT